MSKRFTDTEKWDRPWFLALPPEYKAFWEYLRDKCDRAGIWYVNFELASYLIKSPIDPEMAKRLIHLFDALNKLGTTVIVATHDDRIVPVADRAVMLDAPAPVVVLGDPGHLRQAIGNLLANAVRHTPAGTPFLAGFLGQDVVDERDEGLDAVAQLLDTNSSPDFWSAPASTFAMMRRASSSTSLRPERTGARAGPSPSTAWHKPALSSRQPGPARWTPT